MGGEDILIRPAFQSREAIEEKLVAYGFTRQGQELIYQTHLAAGGLRFTCRITPNGNAEATLIDEDFGEPYTLHLAPEAVGAFVGQAREEYEALLSDIAAKCFTPDIFKFSVTKEMIRRVREIYGDEPEYLWKKSPNNAVWRRADNRKWYGALLTVSAQKLGLAGTGEVEVLNLRIPPSEMQETLDGKRFFPAYHMNKKHWYSALLDGSISAEELLLRIEKSRRLAASVR